MTVYHFFTVTN